MIGRALDLAGAAFGVCVLLLVLDAIVHFALGVGYSGAWTVPPTATGCAAAFLLLVMVVDDLTSNRPRT